MSTFQKCITTDNDFLEFVPITVNDSFLARDSRGLVEFSISGSWAGECTLFRKFPFDDLFFPAEFVWRPVAVWTKNAEDHFFNTKTGTAWRVGFASGKLIAGSCYVKVEV